MAPGPMPMAHRCSVWPQHSQHKRCWCPSRSHALSQASERAPLALCVPCSPNDRQPPGEVAEARLFASPGNDLAAGQGVAPGGGGGVVPPGEEKAPNPGFAVKAGQGRSLITSRDGRAVFRWNFESHP